MCYIPVSHSDSAKEKAFNGFDTKPRWDRFLDFFVADNGLSQTPRVPIFFSGTSHHQKTENAPLAIEFAIGSIFGSIHCIAWNFDFSSRAEQLLWRISSGIITGYAAVAFLTTMLSLVLESLSESWSGVLGVLAAVTIGFGLPVYIVARLILLFFALFTLRDLPPNAYLAVRWTTFLPHMGS